MKNAKLKIYCTSCESKIDVSDQKSLSKVNCPACNTALIVPKPLGDFHLIEVLEEDELFENFKGLADGKEIYVKILNEEREGLLDKFSRYNEDIKAGFQIKSFDNKLTIIRPWHKNILKPFNDSINNDDFTNIYSLLISICESFDSLSKDDFYFNEIDKKSIFFEENKIFFVDSVIAEIIKSNSTLNIHDSIKAAGKLFNYLLFDHSENFEEWTEKYLQLNIKKNFYQFPWVIKGEKSLTLRELVRNMILDPDQFKNFEEIKIKLSESEPKIKEVKGSTKPPKQKPDKNQRLNDSAEKASNKINRSIRRSKKSNNSLIKLLPVALVFIALVIFYFNSDFDKTSISSESDDVHETSSSEERKKKRELAKRQELTKQKELARLEEIEKQNELSRLAEIERQKELTKLEEIKKSKELEKQKELENFLALINPPEDVKTKFNALPAVSSDNLQALMNKHCNDCHNSQKRKGDFVLDIFTKPSSIYRDYEIIKHAYNSVKHGDMPPEDEDISSEERLKLTAYFEKIIYTLESKQVDFDKSALVRRLTPYEFDYTVKDITGLDLKLGESFPGDGGGNQGFANDASLMGVSPIQLEKIIDAAEVISSYSSFDINKGFQFAKTESPPVSSQEFENNLENNLYSYYKIYPKAFNINKYLTKLMHVSTQHILSNGKNDDIKLLADKQRLSPYFLSRFIEYLTSSRIKSIQEIHALQKWQKLQFIPTDKISENTKQIHVAISEFISKYQESKNELSNKTSRDFNKHVNFVKNVEGIFHLEDEEASKFLSGKQLQEYGRTLDILNFLRFSKDTRNNRNIHQYFEPLVHNFLYKVYRRPPDKRALYIKTNDLLEDSLKYGMGMASRIFVIRAFSSFHFTFRIENKTSEKIDDFDLASRISYFLWAGPPDEELLNLAETEKLNSEDVLSKQIDRMLKDPKSARLAKHFASQWLMFGDILEHDGPSKKVFKNFDENLAKDMWQETAMCFNYIVKNDRSVLEIFNADYTFVNNRLSDLYGLNQNSPSFKKVSVDTNKRGGILGHASVLTMTSFGQRTSPIIRGNWILSVLLGTPTPPPPMNVAALPEEDVISENFTLKEQLAKHRNNAACRGCHKKIDPLGIVLENYDVVGRWRTDYQKAKVDAVSKINGEELNGPADLKKFLMDNKIQYIRNLSRKLLSYSLGRSIYYYDNYLINKMIESSIRNDYNFSSLVKTIVLSPQFQLK